MHVMDRLAEHRQLCVLATPYCRDIWELSKVNKVQKVHIEVGRDSTEKVAMISVRLWHDVFSLLVKRNTS